MIGPTYQGSEADAHVLGAIRTGTPLDQILVLSRKGAKPKPVDPEEAVALYERYLEQRIRLWDSPAIKRVHAAYLDHLDALIERFAPAAHSGDVQAAKFVLSAIATIASLSLKFAQVEAARKLAVAASDDVKDGRTGDPLVDSYKELERVYASLGKELTAEQKGMYAQALERRAARMGAREEAG